MIESLRWAKPTDPSFDHPSPASSGPRCLIASRPAASHSRCARGRSEATPAIPHMVFKSDFQTVREENANRQKTDPSNHADPGDFQGPHSSRRDHPTGHSKNHLNEKPDIYSDRPKLPHQSQPYGDTDAARHQDDVHDLHAFIMQ